MSSSKLTPRKQYYKWKNGNFCCVCGEDKLPSRFTKIFSTVGKKKKLCEQIYSLTNFVLEESDGNAQFLKVCRSCEGKLTKTADFKTSAIATLQSIREKGSSKRCLTFSPDKTISPTEKRVNTETSEEHTGEANQAEMDAGSISDVEVNLYVITYNMRCFIGES